MSVRPRVYILVNGIMNWPGDWKDWNVKACPLVNALAAVNKWNMVADRLEYFCGPIGRAFGQRRRARKLKRMVEAYRGTHDLVLVGHSNGCDLVLDALKMMGWPRVEELHLFSGACQADFRKNGLNDAIVDGRVGHVSVYVAGKDVWLRLAHTLVGRWLGYGTLGLSGPTDMSAAAQVKVELFTEPSFGHSTWWRGKQLTASVGLFTRR